MFTTEGAVCAVVGGWHHSERRASLWCNPIFHHNVSHKTRNPLPALLMAHLHWMSVNCWPTRPWAYIRSLYIFLSGGSWLPLLPVKRHLLTETFKQSLKLNWKDAATDDYGNYCLIPLTWRRLINKCLYYEITLDCVNLEKMLISKTVSLLWLLQDYVGCWGTDHRVSKHERG